MDRLARFLRGVVSRGDADCLVYRGRTVSYAAIDAERMSWIQRLDAAGIERGTVVGVQADFSPASVGLVLALFSRTNVAALLPRGAKNRDDLLADAGAEALASDTGKGLALERLEAREPHELVRGLRKRRHAGFVIFSSGSTGRPKAVLHDVERFLGKFERKGKGLRTVAFLLFDHIAGLDTLFYTLGAGGCLILPERREAHHVAGLMDAHRAEVLPASPTFLKLFLLGRAFEDRDLSSLRIVTYGSEPMPPETLERLVATFPGVRVIQKYGTSEFGSPRSRSRGDGSLWMNFHADGMETKVVDGILWVRSKSAMVGYLNAENPFDDGGWYCTEDLVEVDGEWIRILGRESELINVGGEKVHPAEVENVIGELDWVGDVLVRGRSHPITGQVVEALVNSTHPVDSREARKLVRRHCRERLAEHQVPVAVVVTDEPLTSERQKKIRRTSAAS